jgi:hypothetical protein
MKRAWFFLGLFLAQGGAVEKAGAQLTAQDTTTSNAFWFFPTTYVAAPNSPFVEVTVYFAPGDRGYFGLVDYYTEDGTAKAGVDYEAVSGTLAFSGIPLKTIQIPIHPEAFNAEEKYFRVHLFNPNAWIWDSPATVVISCAPTLRIGLRGPHLVISWPGSCEGYVLEQCEAVGAAPWTEVTSPVNLVENRWEVEQPRTALRKFFRLCKK